MGLETDAIDAIELKRGGQTVLTVISLVFDYDGNLAVDENFDPATKY